MKIFAFFLKMVAYFRPYESKFLFTIYHARIFAGFILFGMWVRTYFSHFLLQSSIWQARDDNHMVCWFCLLKKRKNGLILLGRWPLLLGRLVREKILSLGSFRRRGFSLVNICHLCCSKEDFYIYIYFLLNRLVIRSVYFFKNICLTKDTEAIPQVYRDIQKGKSDIRIECSLQKCISYAHLNP